MAYSYRRKRFSKKSRTSRKSSWYNKKYSVGDVAMGAWKTAKYLKGLVNVEFKKYDKSGTGTINSTGAITHITDIAQGDTDQSRNGNSLLLKSINLKFQIAMNGSSAGSIVRCLVFHDKQQVGDTSPSVSDVLDGDAVSPLLAPLNNLTVGRFSILFDRMYKMGNSSDPIKIIKMYRKCLSHVRFNGTASTDIQKNGLYFLLVSNEPTNVPTVSYQSRLTFIDN